MNPSSFRWFSLQRGTTALAGGLCLLLFGAALFASARQAGKVEFLRIGASGGLASQEKGAKEEDALKTLQDFIKEETGFANEIGQQQDWRQLAAQVAEGKLHLGVFQGYEFAWATRQHAKLRPLALAVNVYPYRTAHILVRRDSKAADFASLAGQTFALPSVNLGHLRIYAERQAQVAGKEFTKFFAKVTAPDNLEDAIDDVVDGIVQATVVDRVGLEAYQRRKPGRFERLKEAARSQPLPPPLVAYQEGVLDDATLRRFQEGLLNAKRKEKGERLLTLFRLTGFEAVPKDFEGVLAEMRKGYPVGK